MAEVVSSNQTHDIGGSRGIPIPRSLQHLRGAHLTLNAPSPVTQNGSFECDRIIKAGRVMKRTKKTKVSGLVILLH